MEENLHRTGDEAGARGPAQMQGGINVGDTLTMVNGRFTRLECGGCIRVFAGGVPACVLPAASSARARGARVHCRRWPIHGPRARVLLRSCVLRMLTRLLQVWTCVGCRWSRLRR